MCVIVHLQPNEKLTQDTAREMWSSNPHGAGVLTIDKKGKTKVTHHIGQASLLAALDKTEKFERLVHFRLATHGDKSINNVHPFDIGNGRWFMHNGVLGEFGVGDLSDTHHLSLILRKLDTDECVVLLEALSNASNRFAMTDEVGEVCLIGNYTKHEGMVCSNTYWRRRSVTVTQRGTFYGQGVYTPKPHTGAVIHTPPSSLPATVKTITPNYDDIYDDIGGVAELDYDDDGVFSPIATQDIVIETVGQLLTRNRMTIDDLLQVSADELEALGFDFDDVEHYLDHFYGISLE